MESHQVLDLLWQRIEAQGELPALKRSLSAVLSVMQDETASLSQLTATVLCDFTLTQRVLRLANSAMYSPYGRNVTTVSRALMILGAGTVVHLAMGLQLLETFDGIAETRADAAEQMWLVAFSGRLAREIARMSGDQFGEEAVVTTLISQLGRLLVVFYLPEQWRDIAGALARGASEDDAFHAVLGIGPEELSAAAIRRWELPLQLVNSQVPAKQDGEIVATHSEWLGCITALATHLATGLMHGRDIPSHTLITSGAHALGIDPRQLEDTVLDLYQSESAPQEVAQFSDSDEDGGKPRDAEQRLAQALAEIRSAAGSADAATLIQMVIDGMINCLGPLSCAAFLHNPKAHTYDARFAWGPGVRDRWNPLSFDDAFVPDVFHLALSQGRPIFLEDVTDSKISAKIPGWHRQVFPDVRSIMIVPLRVKGASASAGFLYGNWGTKICLQGISTKEMEYLGAMRALITGALERAGVPR